MKKTISQMANGLDLNLKQTIINYIGQRGL